MLGISSVWRSREIPDGARLLEALVGLGFDGVELEYRVGPKALRQMGHRAGGEVPVLSVHAFFPGPGGGGEEWSGANAFLFSALDDQERETAVRRGIDTLDAAVRVGAQAVVLHLGRVDVEPAVLAGYVRLWEGGGAAVSGLAAAAGRVLDERQRRRAPHLDAVLRSLDRLNREALRRGLLLGVENRFHPHEIPLHDEVGTILAEFRGGAVRYWHDVGHALYLERLGVGSQRAWLESYGEHLAGAHLHDIRGLEDHLAPGTGEADFAAILAAVPAAALKIVEAKASVTREELIAARNLLRRLGC